MFAMLVVAASLSVLPASSVSSGVVVAQPDRAAAAASVAAQKEAIKKLEFLVGDWEGAAKIDIGQGMDAAMEIRQTEAVQSKLGGRVLLIEGSGRMNAGGQDRLVFEALATIGYDPKTKVYSMRAFGPDGAVDPTIEVGENRIVWGFKVTGMEVRYTIWLDDKGRWAETGDRSMDDGKTWNKFIEMTLEKKKAGEEK